MTIAVPLAERIRAEAKQIQFGRTLLAVLGAPFFVLGFLLFWAVFGSAAVLRWCAGATALGWKDARERAEVRGLVAPRGERELR